MTFISFLLICSALIFAMCYVIVSIKSKETLRFKGFSQKEINKQLTEEAFYYTIIAILIFLLFGELTTQLRQIDHSVDDDQFIIKEQ